MKLKTKKWFFLLLLSLSSVAFGYRLFSLMNGFTDLSIASYAVTISFLLVSVMSFIEWISIRKKLGEI
ncbi:hypothetical protein [Chryseobacterium flavum]|uniref:hypothetical protein n=1 Tax=Chryseobacterium flavum TaxID=415851 RepID=UPI002FDB7C30